MLGSYSENISQTFMMECFEEIFNDFSFSAKYSILGVLGPILGFWLCIVVTDIELLTTHYFITKT